MELPEVLNIEKAAKYLGLSQDTLYNYAKAGTVPAFKFGNRWRFKRSVLDKWMEEQSAKPKEEGSSDGKAK